MTFNLKNPNNMQIEFTEGCNQMCLFCGIHSIRDKAGDYKFMSVNLLTEISEQLYSWFGKKGKRIEIALHGEPTLNPNFLKMISILRENYHKAQINLTTNCSTILKNPELLIEIFENGTNILTCDIYGKYKNKFIEHCNKLIPNINVFNYYDKDPPINIYHYKSNKIKHVCIMDSIAKRNGEKQTRVILNHAGNVSPKYAEKYGVEIRNYCLNKKCTRPFREITVEWDGIVTLCCLDFRREFPIAKFPETSLKEIWNSEIWNIVRHLLYNKNRTLTPCRYCDYNGGHRIGLIKPVEIDEKKDLKKTIADHLNVYKKYSINPRKNNFKLKTEMGLFKYL